MANTITLTMLALPSEEQVAWDAVEAGDDKALATLAEGGNRAAQRHAVGRDREMESDPEVLS